MNSPALALPDRTEVAIVGAGPTGLALAVTLAQAGVDFVLLDQQDEGANTSRAAVVHARTLEVLDELGASSELISRGVRLTRFTARDGTRRLLTVPFDGLPTPTRTRSWFRSTKPRRSYLHDCAPWVVTSTDLGKSAPPPRTRKA